MVCGDDERCPVAAAPPPPPLLPTLAPPVLALAFHSAARLWYDQLLGEEGLWELRMGEWRVAGAGIGIGIGTAVLVAVEPGDVAVVFVVDLVVAVGLVVELGLRFDLDEPPEALRLR